MTFGTAISAVAERLGQPLMPWQQLVAEVGGEINPETGLPAYREVIVTVPRQNGKTTLVLSWEVQRALGWGRPQRIVYSAQTGNDARKKLIEDQVPILEPLKTKLGIRQILKGMGNEAIVWKNGSRLVLLASSEDSGHGKTVDFAVKDELFADFDNRRDQALVPSMSTRADAQVLTASTAGTELSVALNQAVARGRQAVDDGLDTGIAYFEWSAAADADADDPETWWNTMPALGHTVTEDVIRHARLTMPDGEFRRAFLNIATVSDERVIPAGTWDLVCSPDAAPSGALTLAIDVNPERSAAAIVVAGGGSVEVIAHKPGLAWLPQRVAELDESLGHPLWVYDGQKSAPVSSVLPDLKLVVRRLEPLTEMAAACGGFYDAVVDRKMTVRRHPSLDAAIAGADRKFVGDGWTWARRGLVDISPLVAATAALWMADRPAPTPFATWR